MTTDAPLQSSLWYRVATLKPYLLARAKLHRHSYRGELWYLLQDPASNRVHRFTPAARLILAAIDGQRSVNDLWRLAQRHLGDDAPTQDEMIQLLGQLHGEHLSPTPLRAVDEVHDTKIAACAVSHESAIFVVSYERSLQ